MIPKLNPGELVPPDLKRFAVGFSYGYGIGLDKEAKSPARDGKAFEYSCSGKGRNTIGSRVSCPDRGHGWSPANAQRGAANGQSQALHFIEQADDNAEPGASHGMPEGDSGAVLVDPVEGKIHAELVFKHSLHPQPLRSKGLVDLPVLHVLEPHTRLLKTLRYGYRGPESHESRLYPFAADVDESHEGSDS